MGHLLPAVSLGTENRDRLDSKTATSLAQQSFLPPQDISEVTSALRYALDAGTQPPASIIHAATEFARILTGAHGVALGIRMKGSLVCRARSGDPAPELGTPLNTDSGITAQCLRSASTLVCEDSESDERVDREACRALGVRSIVAVPVRGTPGALGLLEVFSKRPSAFTQDQIEGLRALTEVIELAHAFDKRERAQSPVVEAAPPALSAKRATPYEIASAIPENKLSRQILDGRTSTRRYWFAAIAAIVLLLGSLAVWLSWHDPTPETAANDTPAPVQPKAEVNPVARHTTFMKPEAGIARPENKRARPDRTATNVLREAADIEPMRQDNVHQENVWQEKTSGNTALPPEEVGEGFIASNTAAEPRTVNISPAANSASLTPLAASTPMMPALENQNARVSQGATEARLVRQVQPNYPARARELRMTGAVVLNATIAEDGSVRSPHVVSGPPVLAAAAVDAVRQWRYTPSLLNGKPVAVEKQITLVFKLP